MSVTRYLSSLLFFCGGKDPGVWREMWNVWRYSEVVEFADSKTRERNRLIDELNEMDFETAEGYMISLLMKISERI